MKIAYCSDLHLEFGGIELNNEQQADVLVLAGDICVARDMPNNVYTEFFNHVAKEFPTVLYIMGNHEHYSGDYAITGSIIKQELLKHNNIHLLDKETIELNGHVFVCGTMWSDMNGFDSETMALVGAMMNDFRLIKNSNRYTYRRVPLYKKDDSTGEYVHNDNNQKIQISTKMKEQVAVFSPEDAYNDHKHFIDYLKGVLTNNDKPIVVVSHHAPSALSTPPLYAHQYHMNGGYRTHLDLFMEDHPEIKLWIHGHMHDPCNYVVGSTRVVANPRGYIGYETIANKFQLQYLKL
jgi:Icc-related predicted phosphoesterase